MPPLPNSNPNSVPYPNQNSVPYPNTMHSVPYPRQSNQSIPSQAAPFGAGFMAPPSAQCAYPPSSTTVYPQQPPNMYNPNSQFLPPQHHQGYSGYGFQQVSSSSSGPSYPIVNNMSNYFTEMQGHIKDVRKSKVCFRQILLLSIAIVFVCSGNMNKNQTLSAHLVQFSERKKQTTEVL